MKTIIKWLKSPVHIMMSLLLVAIVGMGTIAFFTDTEAAVNWIRFGAVTVETDETLEGLKKENIGVTAKGASDCFVRIRVDIPKVSYTGWDEQHHCAVITVGGQTYYAVPEGSETAEWDTISQITNGTDTWVKKDDGYWYLNDILSTDESAVFIDSIEYLSLYNNEDEIVPEVSEDMLTIPITSEAVQADNIVDLAKYTDSASGEVDYAAAAYAAFQIAAGNQNSSGSAIQ